MAACGACGSDEKKSDEYNVGDLVIVDKNKHGKICFAGEDKHTKKNYGPGIVYGIFLSEKRGTMNGTDKGTKFFECADGHGVMVKERRITGRIAADKVDHSAFKAFSDLKDAEAKEEEKDLAEIAEKKARAKMLIDTFNSMDSDGDKLVEKKEFVDYFSKEVTEMSEADAEKLFTEIDASGGGTISLAEMKKYLEK
jgi:dynactin complex subunit